MIYCNECKHEIEDIHINYEEAEPSLGNPEWAEFNCCHGDDVWEIPDYYEEGEFETFQEHYTEEEIKVRFPDIKRVTVWDVIEKVKQ